MERLNTLNYNENADVLTNRIDRNNFLLNLLQFYRFQLEGMRTLKSVEVLETVFA